MFGLMKQKKEKERKRIEESQNRKNNAEISRLRSQAASLESGILDLENAYEEIGSLCNDQNFQAASNVAEHAFGSSVSKPLQKAASIFHQGYGKLFQLEKKV